MVDTAATRHRRGRSGRGVAILVPDDHGARRPSRNEGGAALAEWTSARRSGRTTKPSAAGLGTDTLPGSPFLYLPLRAPMRTRGVLALTPGDRRSSCPSSDGSSTRFAARSRIALERVHYVEVAQQALMQMESERLRNSLLSALSHDLRTPLAALVGLAESLDDHARRRSPERSSKPRRRSPSEARRMSALVDNLLDMARIESGEVQAAPAVASRSRRSSAAR